MNEEKEQAKVERHLNDISPVELNPCPFCGGEAEVDHVNVNGNGEKKYYVCCKNCAAEAGWAKTKIGATRYWNLRT